MDRSSFLQPVDSGFNFELDKITDFKFIFTAFMLDVQEKVDVETMQENSFVVLLGKSPKGISSISKW